MGRQAGARTGLFIAGTDKTTSDYAGGATYRHRLEAQGRS